MTPMGSKNFMSNPCALKIFLVLAATIFPVAAFGGSDSTLPMSPQERPGAASNRLDSVKSKTSFAALHVTEEGGRIGLVISGCPVGAMVERVVLGSPARLAGVRNGDTIVGADARPLAGRAM